MKKYLLLLMSFLAGSVYAYKGECYIDAAILCGMRSIQNTSNNILGKVCTILEKVCDIQECTPTPITQPMMITQSGSYCLATSLQAAGAGSDPLIIIDADVVSLDFASHTLDANGADHALTITGHSKIVISNGCIENAALSGLVVSNGNQITLDDMKFEGNANGVQIANSSCEVSIISSEFRGTTPGDAILCQNSRNIRVIDSSLCENTGSNGIALVGCSGVLVDPTLIVNNTFTSTAAAVLLDSTNNVVISGLQVEANSGSIGFVGVFGINGSRNVEISDSVVTNCSAPNLVRGFNGNEAAGELDLPLNWVLNNCTVSNVTITEAGEIQGFKPGNTALINNCVVSNIVTGTTESRVDCYVVDDNTRVTNNLAAGCVVGGNSETDPAGSFLNGFRAGDASSTANGAEFENNSAMDLMITPTVTMSAGFRIIEAVNNRVNFNNATFNRGMTGFFVSTLAANLNSLFENQAGDNLIGAVREDYRATDAPPVIRTFTTSTGAFTGTPEPFDNIQIVPS